MGSVKKKIKITIKKAKKRIPLPKKPPKTIISPKSYDRKKEKDRIRKKQDEE
jgi:hypothetical protein